MPDPSAKNGKTIGIVIAVVVVAGLIYAFSRGGEEGAGPSGTSSGGGEGTEALLASCTQGTFTGKSDRLSIDVTVNQQTATGCDIVTSVAVSQGAGFFDSYDKDGDGKLTMQCVVPSTVTTFAQLTEHLKGPGLAGCSGEYKDLLGSIE